jgi:2-hydroxychromene-2-carboxylate isomerase
MLEVYSDLWCPFAYVGLVTALDLLANGDSPPTMTARAWPLEVVNGRGMDAGHAAENAHALRAQVAPHLFAGVDHWTFPSTTLPALSAVACATEHDPSLGMALHMALRRALFEEGFDIGDGAVIATLEHDLGLDAHDPEFGAALVARDYAVGLARGVLGSPHFFCDEVDLFCPTLALSRDAEGSLDAAVTIDRLRAFLSNCAVRAD